MKGDDESEKRRLSGWAGCILRKNHPQIFNSTWSLCAFFRFQLHVGERRLDFLVASAYDRTPPLLSFILWLSTLTYTQIPHTVAFYASSRPKIHFLFQNIGLHFFLLFFLFFGIFNLFLVHPNIFSAFCIFSSFRSSLLSSHRINAESWLMRGVSWFSSWMGLIRRAEGCDVILGQMKFLPLQKKRGQV